jgi:hypothetical protein
MFYKSSSVIDITNTNFSSLSNNPSRVDRLIAEYQYEYNRVREEFQWRFELKSFLCSDHSFT